MKNEKDETTMITMTNEQLERTIKTAVEQALRQIKLEEELPGNEEDELMTAPASFSLVSFISTILLGIITSISILFIIICFKNIIQSGFNIGFFMFGIVFLFIVILAFVSMLEVNKTKKIEVVNTIFNAIVGLSSLIVAIIGTYYAYKAL